MSETRLLSGCHENNEELQAAMLNKGLEEGRSLLNNPQHTNSLAAEFEAMSENEVRAISRRVVFYAGNVYFPPPKARLGHQSRIQRSATFEEIKIDFFFIILES